MYSHRSYQTVQLKDSYGTTFLCLVCRTVTMIWVYYLILILYSFTVLLSIVYVPCVCIWRNNNNKIIIGVKDIPTNCGCWRSDDIRATCPTLGISRPDWSQPESWPGDRTGAGSRQLMWCEHPRRSCEDRCWMTAPTPGRALTTDCLVLLFLKSPSQWSFSRRRRVESYDHRSTDNGDND